MLTEAQIIETINEFENPIQFDEVISKIIFLNKIEEGIFHSENNDIISDSNLDNEINEWSK
jgi:hypothetical protein